MKRNGEQVFSIAKPWHDSGDNLSALFKYLENMLKTVRNREIFPDDKTVLERLFPVMEKAWGKQTMPIRAWQAVMNYFLNFREYFES